MKTQLAGYLHRAVEAPVVNENQIIDQPRRDLFDRAPQRLFGVVRGEHDGDLLVVDHDRLFTPSDHNRRAL